MKKIDDLKIKDILPSSLEDEKILAISDGVDRVLNRINKKIDKCYIYKNLENTYSEVVDEMFWEWHVDYYSEDLTLDKKIKLIRNSYVNHLRKGTPWAVENMLNDILDGYQLLEWFEYDGEPYHFKVVTDKEFESVETIKKVNKIIDITKNIRSHFDGLSHHKKIVGTQNYAYANFVAESFEYTQDIRRFREIKNEINYSYFIPYNENVEFKQSTLKFKEFKAITNYNYITTTHENIEYIQ